MLWEYSENQTTRSWSSKDANVPDKPLHQVVVWKQQSNIQTININFYQNVFYFPSYEWFLCDFYAGNVGTGSDSN